MNYKLFISYILYLTSYISLTNEDIFNNMYSSIKNVKTLRANMTSSERINDHVTHSRYAIKLNTIPYKVYTKDVDKGVEILYLEGKNDNKAIVNPNGFPYINLHLALNSKIMRTAQHQTIGRAGFSYISDVLNHTLVKYPDAYTHYIKRDDDTIWDGASCYK